MWGKKKKITTILFIKILIFLMILDSGKILVHNIEDVAL